MLKYLLISIFIFSQSLANGQIKESIIALQDTSKEPVYILVIGEMRHVMGSLPTTRFKPRWIRRIEVLKFENEKNIHGNQKPTVVIYIKRRFNKRVTRYLRLNNKTAYNNRSYAIAGLCEC